MSSDSSLALRDATPTDALCLSMLGAQVFLDTYATSGIREAIAREVAQQLSVDAFLAILANPDARIIVAETDHHLVGFVDVRFGDTHELVGEGAAAQISRLYVQERFTGCGIGKILLAAAESAAAQRGISTMWLTAWVHNRRALDFYRRRGYFDRGATIYTFEGERHENRLFAKAIGRDEPVPRNGPSRPADMR